MKKILLSIVALCCTVVAGAQNEIMTVVLQHGNDVSVFTGTNAFVSANAAAADGDVITLSAGAFNVSDIKKSITVYGAGFEKDEATSTEVTKINGDLYIGVSGGETLADVHLEGLYFNNGVYSKVPLERFVMEKCYVNNNLTLVANSATMLNNCVIRGSIAGGNQLADNCIIQNCYVGGSIDTFNASSNVKIDHCIACSHVGPYYCTNSIFPCSYYSGHERRVFSETTGAVAYNCIFPNFRYNRPDYNEFYNCYEFGANAVFSDATDATYSATRTFEILQPTTWIGNDGKEVGIRYGWSKVPGTPVVKNLNATVAGTDLNVVYEAEAR